MTPEQVREIWGTPRESRSPSHRADGYWADEYQGLFAPGTTIYVWFHQTDVPRCCGFWLEIPKQGIEIEFEGHSFHLGSTAKFVEWLKQFDPELELDEDLIYSKRLGIKCDGLGTEIDSRSHPEVMEIFTHQHTDWLFDHYPLPKSGLILKAEPFVGVGPVKFGMSMEEVHQALNTFVGRDLEVEKSVVGAFFPDLALYALYLSKDRGDDSCHSIACWPPIQIEFLGRELLYTPLRETLSWLEGQASDFIEHHDVVDDDYIFWELGVSVQFGGTSERYPPREVWFCSHDYVKRNKP